MSIVSSVLFIAYLAILVGIGLKQAKNTNSMESYWMANRNLSWWSIGFCLAASWFGLSSFTGQAGWLYGEGMGAMFYLAIPNFAAIALVGIIFTKRIRRIPAISQPEFLEMRYNASVRPWLALIILVAFAGYSAMEFIALQYVFETFMGWPGWIGAIVIVVITMVYVNLGGMNTVVFTEMIQYGLLFLVGAVVGIAALVQGTDIINSGGSIWPVGTPIFSIPTLDSGVSWYNLMGFGLGTTVLLILAYWPAWSTEQSPWQRMWMAKDTKNAYKGAIVGAGMNAIVYIFTIMMAVGAWVVIGPPSQQPVDFNTELIVYKLMQAVLPGWIIPIIVVGFMAAAMSNISNFSTSSASNLSKDIYQRYLRPNASQREMVWASRASIAIALALGVVAGLVMPSILDAVFMAASLATCGYFIPIVGALYWRRGNTAGALAAFIIGSISYLVLALGQLFAGWELSLDPVLIGVVASFLAYVIGSYVTPPPTKAQLLGFFEKDALDFIKSWEKTGISATPTSESADYISANLAITKQGERSLLVCKYGIEGADFSSTLIWQSYIDALLNNKSWLNMGGYDVLYKITLSDMLGNVRLARGDKINDVVFYCEPLNEDAESAKKAIAVAVDDIRALNFKEITSVA
ncbi:MAG: sodium:solute symporter family protein [Synergistaceae bacterium]|jgi:SSS family solute:Na+ symporter|nr:sodium:solute symporter family protein [Synergistaceae bacterium]